MGLASSLPAKNGFGISKPGHREKYRTSSSASSGAEMMAKSDSQDDLDTYSYEPPARHRRDPGGQIRDEIVPPDHGPTTRPYHHIDEGIRFDASLDGIKASS
jgi:acetyl-CoA C-acetyltransferase